MNSFINLMYHNVTPNGVEYPDLSPSVTAYFVDQSTFASHLQAIRQRGHCVGSTDVASFFERSNSNNVADVMSAIQISFDDGWAGSYDVAGPILETHGFAGILFVTTDLVGQKHCVTQSDLSKMDRDVMTIGSHAKTHRFLNRLSNDEIRNELTYSKSYLEDAVGYEVDSLSIPGGALDGRVRQIAEEVGYKFMYTSEIHHNTARRGSMNIGRIAIKSGTALSDIRRYVSGDIRREQFRRRILSIPKRILGQHGYHALRRRVLGEDEEQSEMVDIPNTGNRKSEAGEVALST